MQSTRSAHVVISLYMSVFFVSSSLGQLPEGFLGEDGILTEQEVADGWIALFDGETLFGWRPQPDANWRIENNSLIADQGEVCLLCTTTQFSDYVLKVDFRCGPETNSGIFLRTSPKATHVQRDCYELNIAPGNR